MPQLPHVHRAAGDDAATQGGQPLLTFNPNPYRTPTPNPNPTLTPTRTLTKVGNHLSLLKPDPLRMKPGTDEYHKQTEFARMAFGLEHGPAVNMDRDLGLLAMSSETSCGKMRAVVALLRTFKAKKQKVPPPPLAAALGRNTAQSAGSTPRVLEAATLCVVLQVLLFSYSTQMLDILEAMVVRKGCIHLRL